MEQHLRISAAQDTGKCALTSSGPLALKLRVRLDACDSKLACWLPSLQLGPYGGASPGKLFRLRALESRCMAAHAAQGAASRLPADCAVKAAVLT